ncbi:MAG: Na/Pi cotransporter family protein, partial [Acidimicrobiia bacterium]|nr:Na/Pi cotransporter family protein [Acidimicrobiia bacterium]
MIGSPSLPVHAAVVAQSTTEDLAVGTLLIGLFGGLALFLFGMDQMANSLKAVAGERMKSTLARLTDNRIMGVITGAGVTAVIQSSSVTTVLIVGFISAGLMSFAQSIGVILGADIGTTITAQIIAFKVTKYALAFVAAGFAALFFAKKERFRLQGGLVMGLGLVFFGMGIMGEAMEPLRSYEPFLNLMANMENPLLGILVAAVFTALIQSSSATIGIIIVLAGQGLVSLPAGIALLLGANIGTTITALLASIGRPREALRSAIAHVLFKVVGVMIWVFIIDQLASLSTSISPTATGLSGVDKIAAETPRQIANAHTIFNVINTLLFLPFATQFARLIERFVPDRPIEEEAVIRAKYLTSDLISTPTLALDRARLEIHRMGNRVRDMYTMSLPAVLSGSPGDLDEVEATDDAVDALHGQIIEYLGAISKTSLTEREIGDLLRLMEATNDIENIGDIIETNLVQLGRERIVEQVFISEKTVQVITEYHETIGRALDSAL